MPGNKRKRKLTKLSANITGKRFCKLIALYPVFNPASKTTALSWLCKCDCGIEKVIVGYRLRSGKTKSCGCNKITHNKWYTPTYKIWAAMKRRCLAPTHLNYKDYGGRGITISNSWKKFENFLADMGEQPTGKELDRIDNNKGYFKTNCRWTDRKTNCRNTRKNRLLTLNGITKCISEWAEVLKINKATLHKRITLGWSHEKALTAPINLQFSTRSK